MVSKLHLAVQEACIRGFEQKADAQVMKQLADQYYEIGMGIGIGIHKSPDVFGAFPTDPYSHTPLHRGAQQPGMTGQVKEDILVRFGELGVCVRDGKLCFMPSLLSRAEFLKESADFSYININQEIEQVHLNKNSLAFTWCQVPVIYLISDQVKIEISMSDSRTLLFESLELDKATSLMIFERTGQVKCLRVFIPLSYLP